MSDMKPPGWLDRFLEWYCAENLLEEIQGDLYEAYQDRKASLGEKRANLLYFIDVMQFFRWSSFGKFDPTKFQFHMYRNYFKIAVRNFLKNKMYSTINLGGLVVGLVSCFLIGLHVFQEMSYDKFHPHTGNTYRVVMDMFGNNELKTKSAPIYPAVGPNLQSEYPEVLDFVRILPFGAGVYSVVDQTGNLIRHNEDRAVFADDRFFDMFGFKLIEGDPSQVLASADRIVLSESTARKYFGSIDPVGQTVFWRGQEERVVTGIMEDFPEHSHMQFDMITSLQSWNGYEQFPEIWGWYDFYTYIRVAEDANVSLLSDKLAVYLDEKKSEIYERSNSREVLWLQNIGDIHLHSRNLSWDMGQNGGAYQVYFLMALAFMILVIAWVNFVNLSTARSVKRAKEVGVRKAVGAMRGQLVRQFLTEAFLYNLSALTFAIIISVLLVPVINRSLGMTLDARLLLTVPVLPSLVLLALAGTFISGLYPAFVLTSFRPLEVLKSGFYGRKRNLGFRQVLVVFQFVASIVLLLGTLLVGKQLRYMQSQDLGLNIDQTLVLQGPTSSQGQHDLENRLPLLENALTTMPAVRGFAKSSSIPGVENFSIGGFNSKHFTEEYRDCYRVSLDEHFFGDYEIPLLAGRNFMREMLTDSASVILNEVAVRHLGFSDPDEAIGEYLNPNSDYPWRIIGVVSNYHQATLREDLDPICFFYNPDGGRFFSVKVSAAQVGPVISRIESKWDEIYPDNPFDYFFMDEHFAQLYQGDQRFNRIFAGFTILAILVACLGLFGLVSFTTEQSRKEIGIRKVLGASVTRVVLHLAKDYTRLLAVAIMLAFPLSYFLMDRWLREFAYRTEIGYEIFIFGGLLMTAVALITVSSKSISAATSSPVQVLREE
jgi:putative ABC transport system permease protein